MGCGDALFAPRLLRLPFGSVPTFVSPNEDHFGGSPVLENAKSARNVPTKISFSHTHCRHLPNQGSCQQPIGSLNWDHLSGSKMDLSETTQIKATETAPKNRLRKKHVTSLSLLIQIYCVQNSSGWWMSCICRIWSQIWECVDQGGAAGDSLWEISESWRV